MIYMYIYIHLSVHAPVALCLPANQITCSECYLHRKIAPKGRANGQDYMDHGQVENRLASLNQTQTLFGAGVFTY